MCTYAKYYCYLYGLKKQQCDYSKFFIKIIRIDCGKESKYLQS